jgi:pimeloyl-ACP methyl ester carboxylesterase
MPDEMPQAPGVEHRFVDANGLRVHVAEVGAPNAPAVLLLHGWPQHWYMWRRVMAGLRDDYRLIALDLRGFGWTEAPGHGYDAETFAADQVALLDALGLERAHVVGHDWGGWTAMLMGILHADRVDRMVVCNAPHPWSRLSPSIVAELWRSWYTWLIAMPLIGPRILRNTWISQQYMRTGAGLPFSDEEAAIYARSFQEAERAQAVVELYRYYQRVVWETISGRWRRHRLSRPTLILFGAGDVSLSTKLLPGYEPYADDMRVDLVPDSGHFIVDEKPDLVIERTREWVGLERR